jgi:translation initiation factor 4G
MPTAAGGKDLSEHEIERKAKSIMDEYLHLNDIKEAVACVRELGLSTKGLSQFVYQCLASNVERSSKARQMAGQLMHEVVKEGVVVIDCVVEGLVQLLQLADDMVIDVPMIWQYLAQLISPLLLPPDPLPLSLLRQACQPLKDCDGGDKAGLVVGLVLKDLVHSLGHHKVAELWQESGLNWNDFLMSENVDKFLADNELSFTVTLKPVTERKSSSSDDLVSLLADKNVQNEQVIDWIDENTNKIDETFIRALTTAICRPAWTVRPGSEAKPEDIDVSVIKCRSALLAKYVDHNVRFEMETLYAVQLIVHEHGHPYGALRVFFDVLYDDDIVSEESFYVWRDKPEVGEQTGRGCGKLALDQFYKWLEDEPASEPANDATSS